MKIGFFTDSYLPTRHGVQVSIDSFAVKLEEMGHEVFIHAPYSPGYKDLRPRVVRLKSIKLIKNPEMRFAFPVIHNGALLSAVKNKFDIIHAHTPLSIGVLGKAVSKYQGIPIVYTHHTDYVEYAKFYLKGKIIFPGLARMLTAWFCNAADYVIAPSEKIKKILRGYKVKTPIEVLSTGININNFKRTKASGVSAAALRVRLGIAPEDNVLFFIGRLGGEKNVGFIIEAFAKLLKSHPNSWFVIAGTGPDMESLRKLANKLAVLGRVIFAGWVKDDEKNIYYQMADLFVFASKTDTQGIVILESMASGLPVVALRDDALKGVLIDGVNGYFVNAGSRPAVFAEKISAVLGDPSLCLRLASSAVKTVKDFSEEVQAKKLIDIYKLLINKNGRDTS